MTIYWHNPLILLFSRLGFSFQFCDADDCRECTEGRRVIVRMKLAGIWDEEAD